jgi:hypothetical protein
MHICVFLKRQPILNASYERLTVEHEERCTVAVGNDVAVMLQNQINKNGNAP